MSSNIPPSKTSTTVKTLQELQKFTKIVSKIPRSGRDSGTHSRSSSFSNLTTASDIHSEIGDVASDSVEDFKIDDRVWVNGTKPGYVKYIGKTQFAAGIWAGVLLDDPVGKNDGSVNSIKYFTCEPMRGIFARPGKLRRTAPREGSATSIGNLSTIGSMTPKSSGISPSSRASTCSASSVSPKCPKLKIGDRITVSSLSGLKPGTLRYIGETDFAKGEWAGIELDEPTGKNDGSVSGKKYFSCEMKYGLFAPLHKVSRPGMTTPGSARGTPLMRSSSKDSLCSSVSTCSRASRVKLGVTSLTSSIQKAKTPTTGVTTANKAIQETLKEKEQHIEQLLKERDFDRAEFVRLTSQLEMADAKYADLQKKQNATESEKKHLEDQLSILERKLEDIQFQLEEEKIAKSDFEAQCQLKNNLFEPKRPGEFTMEDAKNVLYGPIEGEVQNVDTSSDSSEFQNKIVELEATIKALNLEKQKLHDKLIELQKSSSKNSAKKDSFISKLSTTIQEKDDMITNLKNELNNNIEKVTMLIEDNKNLNDQIILKEQQAKGHADDVIKELGEKRLDLVAKVEKLTNCCQEKDGEILKLQDELSTSQSNIQTVQDKICQMLGQVDQGKVADITKKIAETNELQIILDRMNKEKSEYEQELANARNEVENLSGINAEREKCLKVKEEIIKSLETKIKTQESEISGLSSQNAELLQNIAKYNADIETGQKMFSDELSKFKKEFETKLSEKEQIIQNIQMELDKYKELVDNKNKELSGKDSEINVLKSIVNEKDIQFDELSKMIQDLQAQLVLTKEENEKNVSVLKSEESSINEFKLDLEKQLLVKEQSFKAEISRLENLIQTKDEEIKLKQSEVSNFLQEVEEKKRLIEILQKELEAVKTDQKKVSKESSSVYQELNRKLSEMELKYKELLEEKEKIAKEELQTRDAKKNLEVIRDSLLQEKSAQEEIVKDREAKLQALQAEVNRMKVEFSQHKQELQAKIDISQQEIQAGIEFKKEFEVQHSVIEELNKEVQKIAEEKCKTLDSELQVIPVITSDKNKLQTQVEELQKLNKEKSEEFLKLEEKYRSLEELLENNKNLVTQREKEVSVLKEQLEKMSNDKVPFESMTSSLKSLEEENSALKNKITILELEKEEKKSAQLTNPSKQELSPEEEQEIESLLSQVDFLNSIIVDMKQKNEELTRKLEAQATCWEEEGDVNLNESTKVIAPRLFCDICDMFDLHETCDCPKQESFQDEEIPQLRRAGTQQIEERPYCNNCEMFGHWTLDCQEPDTF